MTLSDLIINYLEQFGVEYVFSVPGGPLGPLYDALVRSEARGGPRSILARHEVGGAFMADGYARETGKIGVCCATTGPGATNLITGVASAYTDHIPLLVITPQTRLPDFSMGAFQESSADGIDIPGMFEHCTRYNTMVTHADQLEKKLAAALTTALRPPKGPVHLSVPVDLLRSPKNGQIAFPNLQTLLTQPALEMDVVALETLCKELHHILNQNRQVVLVIGHDCAGAAQEIIKFAELIGAPIVTTQRGKSWINPYHPLARGVFGFSGHKTARKALTDESVDLILAVGTNLNEWSTSGWDSILMNDKLVHIHNEKTCFGRSPMARLHVYGTIRTIFKELISRLETLKEEGKLFLIGKIKEKVITPKSTSDHLKESPYVPHHIEVQAPDSCRRENTSTPIKPQRVICEIIQRVPNETRFLIDNSNSVPWSIHYFFHRRPENYHLSIGFASMGWAIGASVGMALGKLNTPVVCFTGDGCFLMSGQEITVAVEEQLPVIFVVLNDHSYGMIRHGHRMAGKETVNFSIPPVDFCMMAKATGANAHKIQDLQDFEHIDFQSLCKRKGPTLLDVTIDPEEAPPIGMF
ncbi:MAG: thiamine pyrophosphate-binding protein [Deltaproteobacteria bacterium]|nr:thiamine pyrophosphate-binding protein [Deltaproteobacteria bacterium]MBW2088378.1 thiamine pyrophosphate-binding protein [Deltaproteobacteria bacterium]